MINKTSKKAAAIVCFLSGVCFASSNQEEDYPSKQENNRYFSDDVDQDEKDEDEHNQNDNAQDNEYQDNDALTALSYVLTAVVSTVFGYFLHLQSAPTPTAAAAHASSAEADGAETSPAAQSTY